MKKLNFKHISIRYKLWLCLLSLSIVPMGIIGYLSLKNTKHLVNESMTLLTNDLITEKIHFIHSVENKFFSAVNSTTDEDVFYKIAKDLNYKDQNEFQRFELRRKLQNLFDRKLRIDALQGLYVISNSKKIVSAMRGFTSHQVKYHEIAPLIKIDNKKSFSWSGVFKNYDKSSKLKHLVAVSKPIIDLKDKDNFNNVIGHILVVIDLHSYLSKYFKEGSQGNHFILLDSQNHVITSDNERIIGKEIAPVISKNLLNESKSFQVSIDNDPQIMTFKKIRASNWKLLSYFPTKTIDKKMYPFILGAITISGILIIFFSLTIQYINLRFLRPIREITKSFKRMEYSREISTEKLKLDSSDEIGELVTWYNTFVDKQTELNKYQEKLELLVNERTSALSKTLKEREQMQQNLITSSKLASLGEVASGIAHEINNPLAVIKGENSRIKKELTREMNPERLTKCINKIDTTVDRIVNIIKGLKTFSRDATGDPFVYVPINNIIKDTLSICREKFKYHEIDIQILGDCTEETIRCRSAEISQILVNLLTNAYDEITQSDNKQEKWIKIHLSKHNGYMHIRVQDSGNGITSEVLKKIMDPFFTTKPVGKGTGLGLSVSLGIAENHGGSLTYQLYEGHTSFLLICPMSEEQREKASA